MKKKILPAIVVLLVILVAVLFFKVWTLKWDAIYAKAVPDVELTNDITFDSNGVASGEATGFVAFDDVTKQPKGLRQYVRISTLGTFKDGKQVFFETDIIKMDALAPRYFAPVVLTVSHIEGNVITLTDGNNNSYLIDKSTGEISMFDSTRDVTKLITNQSEFREFMLAFLK